MNRAVVMLPGGANAWVLAATSSKTESSRYTQQTVLVPWELFCIYHIKHTKTCPYVCVVVFVL